MAHFKDVYTAFVKGEAPFTELSSSLEAFLQQHPDQGHKIQIAMAKLHQFHKLSAEEFRQILGVIATHSGHTPAGDRPQPAAAPADNTAESGEDENNTDSTVVRQKPAAGSTQTGRTSRSQFTWTGYGEGEYLNLEVGMVVKDRFLLEGVIGEGGMGFIFKAKDLRKEEAQDRNPYIAIKVLNESFKDHPEALKALQREARKSQDLSHPNIITVFDFDRDGDNVYMTMELMEGTPLDKFIKTTLKEQPISVTEALRITQEMGLALAYAHSKNIVHSDFKPGNVFLQKDHSVKVFDFGIARASKQGLTGAQGEMTRFDAGTLGALTPAYASLEMMLGEEPDQRDDIYALACVCHELLTGKHPFDKKSADLAMAANMTVAPIKGLDRKQMKGLLKGLAFKRADRSESVEQFLEDIRKVTLTRKEIGVRVGAVAVLAGVLAVGVPFYLDKRTFDTLSAGLRDSNLTQVAATLDTIDALEKTDLRDKIISNTDNQQQIVDYIGKRAAELFNLDSKHYGYQDAKALVQRGLAYYRDSATLRTLADQVEHSKAMLMLMLDTLYTQFIQDGKLLDDGTDNNMPAVLTIVRTVDPDNYLLKDKRLPDAYLTASRQRFDSQDLDTADKLVTAGLERFNDDIALVNMQDTISAERLRLEQVARIATLSSAIETALPNLTADSDISTLGPAALELRGLDPGNLALEHLYSAAETLGEPVMAAAVKASDWTTFDTQLSRYKQIASPLWTARKRGQLAKAQGQFDQLVEAMKQELTALVEKIDLRLTKPEFKPVWEAELRVLLQDTEAVATVLEQPDAITDVNRRVATVYIQDATALREKSRFTEAEKRLIVARRLAPNLPELATETTQLAAATEAFEKARLEQLRLARIEALRQSIRTQARADDVVSARKSFDELATLSPDDDYLKQEGRQLLVDSYGRAAKKSAQAKQFDQAVAFVTTALQLAPDNTALALDLKRYTFEQNKALFVAAFQHPTTDGLQQAQQHYEQLRNGLSPTDVTALQNDIAPAIAGYIKSLAESNLPSAHLALQQARAILGDLPALQQINLPALPEAAPEPEPAVTEETAPAQDPKEALLELAGQGDAASQFLLATNYYRGENDFARDYAKAAEWYEKVAKRPVTDLQPDAGKTPPVVIAQSTLAGMYFEGKGVPKDMKKTFEWHRKAAENGFVASQNVVATYYLEGKDIPQDYAEAFKWFTKASNQGYTDSQSGLGLMYFQGWGVAQDLAKAFDLFNKAGRKGDLSSQSALGVMYFAGLGVPKDMQKAYMWTTVAVANGFKDEENILANAGKTLTPEQISVAKEEAASISKKAKKRR